MKSFRYEIVREDLYVRVVQPDIVVITQAFDADPVLRTGEFGLHILHELVAVQLGIIFDDHEQAADGRIELAGSGGLVVDCRCTTLAGPGNCDLDKDILFLYLSSFGSRDEIRYEIESALVLDFYLLPLCVGGSAQLHHLVVARYGADNDVKEQNYQGNDAYHSPWKGFDPLEYIVVRGFFVSFGCHVFSLVRFRCVYVYLLPERLLLKSSSDTFLSSSRGVLSVKRLSMVDSMSLIFLLAMSCWAYNWSRSALRFV